MEARFLIVEGLWIMNVFLLFFVLGAVLTAIAALVLVSTTASAGGYEGEPVRVKSQDR